MADFDTIPPILFKYYAPERLDVLTRAQVRISQRQVVNDNRDFTPTFIDAARPEVLAHHIEQQVAKDPTVPAGIRPALVRFLAANFREQMLELLLSQAKVPDNLGMLCLTDKPQSEFMWSEYAARSTGFVVAFYVPLLAGTVLPRLIIKRVRYTDAPIAFADEAMRDLSSFYQKDAKWAPESEWRGTGLLARFPAIGMDDKGYPIHMCSLPRGSVRAVLVRPQCTVENQIRNLFAIDARYHGAEVIELL